MLDYASSRSLPREQPAVLAFLRRLDWVLFGAVAALVAYGLWGVAGITRHDVAGNELYYVVRQAIAIGLGFAGLLLVLAVDPDRFRRAQKPIFAATIVLMLLVFALGDETLSARPGLRAYEGKTVVLGIRPEDLEDAELEPDTPSDRRLKGRVVLREALGAEIMAHFAVDARLAMTEDVKELARDVGDERLAEGEGAQEATLVGRFGPRSRVREGDEAEVAVETRALHFFERKSGLAI